MCRPSGVNTSRVESDVRLPLLVLFSSFPFKSQAGPAFMLMHVNLFLLPDFETIGPLALPPLFQWTTNSGEQMPLNTNDNLA